VRQILYLLSAAGLLFGLATRPASAVTDDDVRKSIERGRQWLLNQETNGLWPELAYWNVPAPCGNSEIAALTLLVTGSHPINDPAMVQALDALLARKLDYNYAVSLRVMAYAQALRNLPPSGPRRDLIRRALVADAQWLVTCQHPDGGWSYRVNWAKTDLSNTQFSILALWEAAKAGVEVPDIVWQRTLALYLKLQKTDGSWNYGSAPGLEEGGDTAGYGSMSAAGLATIYICSDMLDMASGCPCLPGKSGGANRAELNKRIDLALSWLEPHFDVSTNPAAVKNKAEHVLYWLYGVERVGLAAGYKYFGSHNWYKEGAERLLSQQGGDGSWAGGLAEAYRPGGANGPADSGRFSNTCFAILFLYKGRAPILFNKLQCTPGGDKWEWNPHRRDAAHLTAYFEKTKEQLFQWQIVSLRDTVDDLHEAPILYISAESAPNFTADEQKKLREFTDTGGTILFEASCGNKAVRDAFAKLAKEVWPEWAVKPLGPEHPSFLDPNPLKQRPEIMGIDDGIRTGVFYAMDDISCAWQTKSYLAKEYLFKWGVNVFTYATDHSPLRAKLDTKDNKTPAAKSERYIAPVRNGGRSTLTLARLKTDGDWIANRNYKGFERIYAEVARRAGINLSVTDDGVDASALTDQSAAYLTGSKEVTLPEPARQALKTYLAKGGFLWAEAAAGATAFDQSFSKLAADLGLELKPLDKAEPLMTGKFTKAAGYDLTTGVQFRHSLRVIRMGRPSADLIGLYLGGKMVGVYSPFDIVFSATPYEAGGCRGYLTEDAIAVATNILVAISDR
jgi:hypothetical protein